MSTAIELLRETWKSLGDDYPREDEWEALRERVLAVLNDDQADQPKPKPVPAVSSIQCPVCMAEYCNRDAPAEFERVMAWSSEFNLVTIAELRAELEEVYATMRDINTKSGKYV